MGNYPDLGGDSSKPILKTTLFKGDKGDPAVLAVAQPWHLALPCDDDGSNVDYTNKSIIIMVVKANSILAEGATVNGWSMIVDSETNCTVSINNLIADVDVIASNHASFRLKLSHSSYNDLYLNAKVSKIHKGEKGDTGDTGSIGGSGSQGEPGPTGQDGTGLVFVKHYIEVLPRVNCTVTNYGGKVLITTVTDHGFVLGELVFVDDIDPYPDLELPVLEVVTSKTFTLDYTYGANNSGRVFSYENFRAFHNDTYQILKFPDIFPLSAKIDELVAIFVDGSGKTTIWDVGTAFYPNAGYAAYANSHQMALPTDLLTVNLWDKDRSGYNKNPIVEEADVRKNIYVRTRLYNSSWFWDTDMVNDKFNLIIAYKFFDIDLV